MNPETILIVEDEKDTARLVSQRLVSLGYDVWPPISTGEGALEQLEQQVPDLIIMAIDLAGEMDGITAVQQIQRKYDIPVIFLSANLGKEVIERIKLTEPYGLITKPINDDALQTTVELSLHKFRLEQKRRELIMGGEKIPVGVWQNISRRNELESRLDAIYQFGQELPFIHDEVEILGRALEVVKQTLNFEITFYGLVDVTQNILRYYYRIGEPSEEIAEMELPLDGPSGIGPAVIRTNQAIKVAEIEQDERFVPLPGLVLKTEISVPLRANGQVIGVLNGGSKTVTHYTEDDLQLLQTLADQTAIAIENARLFEAEQKARKLAETLQATNMALSRTLNLESVLNILLTRLGQLVPLDRVSILLLENPNWLKVGASFGYEDLDPESNQHVEFRFETESIENVKFLIENRSGLIIPDVAKYPAWVEQSGQNNSRSWIGVPLIAGEEVLGIFSLENDIPDFFQDGHLEMLELLAAPAAIAIKNALLHQEVQEHLDRLRRSQAQLIHSEKMGALGRLAVSIAHEINNPLQAVHTSLMLMQEDLTDQSYGSLSRYLDIVNREIERVAKTVSQLRDFYQPAQKDAEIIDVFDVLEEVVLLASNNIEESEVDLTFEWVKTPPLIEGNSAHLKQVFLNLVVNALDAMPDGGSLHIGTRLDEIQDPVSNRKLPAVCIEVRDSGMGIPPDALDKLFEPFYTTKERSSGLGLMVSHGIISAHGGHIRVESVVGDGTAFFVYLPRIGP